MELCGYRAYCFLTLKIGYDWNWIIKFKSLGDDMLRIINVLFLVSIISGCAGLSLRQPERWVENNTLYSTKLPSTEVKVIPALIFDKKESKGRLGASTDGHRHTPSGVVEEMFSFFDNSRRTRLSIIIENLTGQNWYMAPPDYGSNPNVLVVSDETVGGVRFTTGIFKQSVEGKPRLIKRFGTTVGESTRYTLVYSTAANEDLIKKSANMLSAADWDYIYTFNKLANESFSIGPYSGTLPPTQKEEQKKRT